MYANVRGIKGKIVSLADAAEQMNPELILLTETHLKQNAGVRMAGYTFFGRPRTEGCGGGVGILVKNEKKCMIAPHSTTRALEITWVSVRRDKKRPIFVGVYYGKQESRVSKAEIEYEIDLLIEEIEEKQREGEVILAMDGNGKVGIMGEPISRNGALLLKAFAETNMKLLNKDPKCCGKITRQNTKKKDENSAIDFIVCSNHITSAIEEMKIDEEGLYKITGNNQTDHNTIILKMNLSSIAQMTPHTPQFRINAPAEKWDEFRDKLSTVRFDLEHNMSAPLTEVYHEWKKCIESIAFNTIGKTTKKNKPYRPESATVKGLRKERRSIKMLFENEPDVDKRAHLKNVYIEKQKLVRTQLEKEEKEGTENKIQQILKGDKNAFWKDRSKFLGNTCDDWNIVKNKDGTRLFDPCQIKDTMVSFYQNLYAKPRCKYHPYHNEITESNNQNMMDMSFESNENNREPSLEEIKAVLKKKKNGKSTTDIKNEILKRGGDPMATLIYPLVLQFWRSENVAKQWNHGLISSIWKKKGDQENLNNHRGITVSSAVGTIPEEILDDRIQKTIKFTQFQAGGRKGCCPVDHIFIIRGIISYALHKNKRIILTMYDVEKAYDHADVDDMLHIAWKDGVRGKIWRLTRTMNTELTANIKTKHGVTSTVKRESGGKQGGKIIVTLFSRLMDELSYEMQENRNVGITIDSKEINDLLYVDDALTLAEGKAQQEETLKCINEFAIKHKIKWGPSKCKVLEIGKHTNIETKWKLGDENIEGADSYKYLGDHISRKGTNNETIGERIGKMKVATREVISYGTRSAMRKLKSKMLIELHEAISIPSLLYNSESWTLSITNLLELEKIEVWALKRILNLPPKTPTAAVRFETGTLFVEFRIDQRKLTYLHKVLQRSEDHWTHHILNTLNGIEIGWAAEINWKLKFYNLETDWKKIAKISIGEWKIEVKKAIEKANQKRLLSQCFKDRDIQKTKTKYLVSRLQSDQYQRGTIKPSMNLTRLESKAIIMARSGMLDCATNYKNKYGVTTCKQCTRTDDENHRINECEKYSSINNYAISEKFDFSIILTDTVEVLQTAAKQINKIWDLANGKNVMRLTTAQ